MYLKNDFNFQGSLASGFLQVRDIAFSGSFLRTARNAADFVSLLFPLKQGEMLPVFLENCFF